MHDNRGFERRIRADIETQESTLEGSSDPGYSSNTPPRPVKIPLRPDEPGTRLLPIPSGDLDEPSSFYGETMSSMYESSRLNCYICPSDTPYKRYM